MAALRDIANTACCLTRSGNGTLSEVLARQDSSSKEHLFIHTHVSMLKHQPLHHAFTEGFSVRSKCTPSKMTADGVLKAPIPNAPLQT